MQCPNDQATLVMSERSGIEIDYCPECRGVWLDRGELDKIIDRAAGPAPGAASAVPPVPPVAPMHQQGYRPGMAVPRNGYASPGSPGSPGSWDKGRRGYGQPGYGQPGYGQQNGYRGKRRGNWLSELFD
ncbi:zf-TFIIB domain-containing protein [Curtobacterium sp. VKM Ac-1376]|uniref:TFIIB-type zinc ribbon-containing protein n=1 Tax=Curtobacterium sp. VKM Ac-1376 TaxID=123312 RepID=UPI00188CC88E|nr:zf-TFIIB domain-containing protein [Curtobacterium sp. VKM Ac-1376]MBF4613388.1 zf-TFIIB domain-containing protein [Curtobacterium sp. VKM Ac-1376]